MLTRRGFIRSLIGAGLYIVYEKQTFAAKQEMPTKVQDKIKWGMHLTALSTTGSSMNVDNNSTSCIRCHDVHTPLKINIMENKPDKAKRLITKSESDLQERFFSSYCPEISMLVMVTDVYSFTHSEYDGSMEVYVNCLGGDGVNLIDVELYFPFRPECAGQRDALVRDLKKDSIAFIKGDYSLAPLTLYPHEYHIIEPEFIQIARECLRPMEWKCEDISHQI